jgi:hypothetical protein
MKSAKKLHTVFIRKLKKKMKEKCPGLFGDVIYTGSAYEGVKVRKNKDDDDLEFDVMVLMDIGHSAMIESTNNPAYVKIKYSDALAEENIISEAIVNQYISSKTFVVKFRRLLQECIRDIQAEPSVETSVTGEQVLPVEETDWTENRKTMFFQDLTQNVKLSIHGPAVQMDVWDPFAEKKFFSVDVVPTLTLQNESNVKSEAQYYVAKTRKDPSTGQSFMFDWRKSYSVQEKDKLDCMDHDNGCRKQVFRILKAIRNREAGLKQLTTYHIKTVLFREIDYVDQAQWKSEFLGRRLFGMLWRLRNELESGEIEHYFLRFNLFEVDEVNKKRKTTIKQMGQRISCLLNSQKKLEKILKM